MNSSDFDIHYHEMVFRLACHERTGGEFQPAFTLFNQHSLALYDSPGRLIIEPKAGTGYKLDYICCLNSNLIPLASDPGACRVRL